VVRLQFLGSGDAFVSRRTAPLTLTLTKHLAEIAPSAPSSPI